MKILFHKIFISGLIILILVLTSCKQNPDRALVISKLKNSAKLATVEYIVTKVISAKDHNLFGKDAYFFAETEAIIKAGIDLEKLKEEDVKIDGLKISLKLPAVEIVNLSYPAEGFKVIEKYSDETAVFKWNSIGVSEKDDLFRQGESDIRANINDLGIINSAQANTRILLKRILTIAGFEEIYIEFAESKSGLESQDKQLLYELKEFYSRNKD
jgi:hypothetical protein